MTKAAVVRRPVECGHWSTRTFATPLHVASEVGRRGVVQVVVAGVFMVFVWDVKSHRSLVGWRKIPSGEGENRGQGDRKQRDRGQRDRGRTGDGGFGGGLILAQVCVGCKKVGHRVAA